MNKKTTIANVDAVVAEINEKFGKKAVVCLGTEMQNPFTDRISTGSIGLDCALGGGLTPGLSMYVGQESAGKTFMALKAAVEVQRKYQDRAKIVYASIESPVDPEWLTKVGITLDDTFVYLRADSGETYLEVLKDFINSNTCQLVIIDSLPALVTRGELDGDLADKHVAIKANLINAFLSHCVFGAQRSERVPYNETAILAINQYRAKIGGWSPTGEPKQEFGGYPLKYAKLVDVEFASGQKIVAKGEEDEKIEYGKQIKYRVLKSKVSNGEGSIGMFKMYKKNMDVVQAGNIDEAEEYRIVGCRYDVIKHVGRHFELSGASYGQDDLEQKIREDSSFKAQLRDQIFTAAGITKEVPSEKPRKGKTQ